MILRLQIQFITISIFFISEILSDYSKHLLQKCLFRLLPLEDRYDIFQYTDDILHVRNKRDVNLKNLEVYFDNPFVNSTSLDKYIDDEEVYNISSGEFWFYRQPSFEFNRRIYNRFNKWQTKCFNESMKDVQNKINHYLIKHTHLRNIPSKEGLKLLFKGLCTYKNNMVDWIKHTFISKPKTLVREEKVRLEQIFLINSTNSIPRDKLRDFWVFEKCFSNMMRWYENNMTKRVMTHHDKVMLHYIDMGDKFTFPKTSEEFDELVRNNEDVYIIDLGNQTTTYATPYSLLSLDSEQKKAAIEQRIYADDFEP